MAKLTWRVASRTGATGVARAHVVPGLTGPTQAGRPGHREGWGGEARCRHPSSGGPAAVWFLELRVVPGLARASRGRRPAARCSACCVALVSQIYKSTKCNDMRQTGHCPRGPFCAFAHVDSTCPLCRERAGASSRARVAGRVGGLWASWGPAWPRLWGPQGPECGHCDQMSPYKAPEGEAASGSGGAQM